MNDAAKWWYYVRQNGASYYPQTVANLGYDVWDWSTLNAGTLFQDSAKTTPATANGDVVGCWVDRVKLTDAAQVTTAVKPTLATASLNGLPTLSFDGGDLLATGNISISTFAVWAVFRHSGTVRFVYEQSTTVASNPGMYLATSNNATIGTSRTVGTLQISSKAYLNVWAGDNTWRVVRNESNGTHATQNLAINSSLVNLTTYLTDNADIGTGTATQPLFIGARSGPTLGIIGNIAHLCIVSPYPTAEIIANMESYINGIWSVY